MTRTKKNQSNSYKAPKQFSKNEPPPNQNKDIFDEIINYTALKNKQIKKNLPKILIDASLVLDVLLERHSIFLNDAISIVNLVLTGVVNGYITELGLRDIWDISRKMKSQEDANYLIIKLLNSFNVCTIDSEMIKRVREYHLSSFETGIQLECLKKNQLDIIITLRTPDFLKCGLTNIFSPSQFLESYTSNERIRSAIKICSAEKEIFHRENFIHLLDEKNEDDLSLFQGWKIEHFDLLCSKNNLANASVILFNTQSNIRHSESAFGSGATATLFAAFDKAILHIVDRPTHTIESVKVSNLEEGVEGSVSAFVVVNHQNHQVRKLEINTNIIKACFYAYVKAIISIYDNNDCNSFENRTIVGLDCQEISLSPTTNLLISQEQILAQYKIGERNFSQSNLRETNFTNQNFSGANFRNCDFSFSNLEGVNLIDANLEETIFKEVNLFHASLENVNMSRSQLYKAKLNKANLENANLSSADLSEVCLDNAILIKANFSSAVLTKGILSEANLTYAILWRADLIEVNLSKACLIEADLTGANLTKANLSCADLTGANLTKANLSGADLTGANLTNANFSGANLTGVELNRVKFIDGVNFSDANFSKADLTGLDLNKTIFCKPILTDTKMPQIKIQIYGYKRIERIIELLNQFDSDKYIIYAVHSSAFGYWWNSNIGQKFKEVNKKLSDQKISIKRVFIVPEENFKQDMHEIIAEQVNSGIKVRCLSEVVAKNLNGYDLSQSNFLICKNISVPENSFTTMMLVNKDQEEESGYISFVSDDIQTNEQRFSMIWEQSIPLLPTDNNPIVTATQ